VARAAPDPTRVRPSRVDHRALAVPWQAFALVQPIPVGPDRRRVRVCSRRVGRVDRHARIGPVYPPAWRHA